MRYYDRGLERPTGLDALLDVLRRIRFYDSRIVQRSTSRP
jgi:hypothetical protein